MNKIMKEKAVSELTDLEEELIKWHKEHFKKDGTFVGTSGFCLTNESQLDIARHFAEWQKHKDEKTIETADKVYFESCTKIRRQMIDKACEWLEGHNPFVNETIALDWLKIFRKAMEG